MVKKIGNEVTSITWLKLFAAIKRANRTSGIDSPVTIWRAYNKTGKNQIERQGEREADREREETRETEKEREKERKKERKREEKCSQDHF